MQFCCDSRFCRIQHNSNANKAKKEPRKKQIQIQRRSFHQIPVSCWSLFSNDSWKGVAGIVRAEDELTSHFKTQNGLTPCFSREMAVSPFDVPCKCFNLMLLSLHVYSRGIKTWRIRAVNSYDNRQSRKVSHWYSSGMDPFLSKLQPAHFKTFSQQFPSNCVGLELCRLLPALLR